MATAKSNPVKGINIAGIEKIKTALKEYTSGIEQANDLQLSTTTIQAAIKGTQSEDDLNKSLKKIQELITSYLGVLSNYDDVLTQIEQAYKQNDSDNQEFYDVSEYFEKRLYGNDTSTAESRNEMY